MTAVDALSGRKPVPDRYTWPSAEEPACRIGWQDRVSWDGRREYLVPAIDSASARGVRLIRRLFVCRQGLGNEANGRVRWAG